MVGFNKRIVLRAILVISGVLLAFYALLPIFFPSLDEAYSFSEQEQPATQSTPPLQTSKPSGLQLTLQLVPQPHELPALLAIASSLESAARAQGVFISLPVATNRNYVVFDLVDNSQKESMDALLTNSFAELDVISVKQNAKGFWTYEVGMSEIAYRRFLQGIMEKTLATVRNRVDVMAVEAAEVVQLDDSRIRVFVPGGQDSARIKAIFESKSNVEFVLAYDDAEAATKLPGTRVLPMYKPLQGEAADFIAVSDTPVLTGADIADVKISFMPDNRPGILFTLTDHGREVFAKYTAENIGRRLAIVVNDVVYSAPVVMAQIDAGIVYLSGVFSMDEARDLLLSINSGTLPAMVMVVEEKLVGAGQ